MAPNLGHGSIFILQRRLRCTSQRHMGHARGIKVILGILIPVPLFHLSSTGVVPCLSNKLRMSYASCYCCSIQLIGALRTCYIPSSATMQLGFLMLNLVLLFNSSDTFRARKCFSLGTVGVSVSHRPTIYVLVRLRCTSKRITVHCTTLNSSHFVIRFT